MLFICSFSPLQFTISAQFPKNHIPNVKLLYDCGDASVVWFRHFFFFPLSNLQQLEQIQKELSVLEEDIKRVEVRSRISYISSSFSIS